MRIPVFLLLGLVSGSGTFHFKCVLRYLVRLRLWRARGLLGWDILACKARGFLYLFVLGHFSGSGFFDLFSYFADTDVPGNFSYHFGVKLTSLCDGFAD